MITIVLGGRCGSGGGGAWPLGFRGVAGCVGARGGWGAGGAGRGGGCPPVPDL